MRNKKRQIVLDTETTGLEWSKGNRIVEIGAVELLDRRLSGDKFHRYLKPDVSFESGAQEVTGLTMEFLADKPEFSMIADKFLAYINGAELIIHNAAFDLGFLDYELSRLGSQYGKITDRASVLDTLVMARERYPGQRNSLDALCKRLGVDNAHRQLHGALLDAQILADVYIALTSGQEEIGFALPESSRGGVDAASVAFMPDVLLTRPCVVASQSELEAHEARLAKLRKIAGHVLWDAI
ncbi:DNA polymerase III subunit epsilon [Xylella fastidiosa subsp. fastidiosa]|jgi:DNA polymerase-3 subunit epsilon|uniref:DNA polymerase III subunit epsilon n=4 Tax=Xylella fastidiosa TaxID=2371 RepID=Q87C77_XYLFT|nr:DNA polymerase III subunit epsilon [Xylella fastidiosa]ADN62051.1 DNA polymerase III subunit epsilon [Xylella fastidiosa subsp. fastidiosa GB514]KAF0571341.1 DNA polymerase III subunit epsilon [Xylella fastidiosa subsp. fastidiosa Mus-1]AAO29067.1 DNA polymerase III epsilon chain [Xylella fastidiosa Temecula1]ACB92717.1 DNA polymerase III, epsilon subunit [Xylella fastidiosa M23]AIC10722.1 DNA polymerase III subunit epsilon [Xylella fastidiosa subsp. sandyi Ann-1]